VRREPFPLSPPVEVGVACTRRGRRCPASGPVAKPLPTGPVARHRSGAAPDGRAAGSSAPEPRLFRRHYARRARRSQLMSLSRWWAVCEPSPQGLGPESRAMRSTARAARRAGNPNWAICAAPPTLTARESGVPSRRSGRVARRLTLLSVTGVGLSSRAVRRSQRDGSARDAAIPGRATPRRGPGTGCPPVLACRMAWRVPASSAPSAAPRARCGSGGGAAPPLA
jgi:hypothetical protein